MSEARASLVSGMQVTKAVSLVKPLGSGGMGAVWLADHHGLKTQVVVKFMLLGLDASDTARSRFSREAAAAAQVKSPHVVQMLDHGVSDDGTPFIVMEHLEGHDLGDEIEKHGALDPAKVIVVVSQVAKALSKVHAAGLLHRDIKPDNIFLCAGEEEVFVKLLDFGIAKNSAAAEGDGSLDGETKTGQIVGTPYYMSPEQVTAQKTIDHRADLWALGVVAYEALTGKRPYDGPSFGALAVKIATGLPPRPSAENPALPPAVDEWFAKACAHEAVDRFSSAKEMADALRAAFEGVVSLPLISDSGQRSPSVPEHSGDRVRSGATPTFGLAETAVDDLGRNDGALGKSASEGGVSVVGAPPTRGSRFLRIGGATALTVVAGGVIAWTAWRQAGGAPASAVAAPPSIAALPSTVVVPASAVSVVSVLTAPASAPPPAVAVAAEDAGPPVAKAVVTGVKAQARPTGAKTAAPPVKPSAEPPAKPTAKPASTDPDLF